MTSGSKQLRAEVSSESKMSSMRQIMRKVVDCEKSEKIPSLKELYEESMTIRGMLDRQEPIRKMPNNFFICKCV